LECMRVRLSLLAALVVALSACGGGGGTGGGGSSDAAALVPAGALAYVGVDTDLGSAQLKSASAILDKFPVKARLLRSIRSELSRSGADIDALKASIGPELDVAVLDVNGKQSAVGFTRPKDEQAFDAQLDRGSSPPVHTKIDGWTVFADKQALLDAVKGRKANLADDPSFQAAMKTVPAAGDVIARAYASTAGAQAALGRAAGSIGPAGSALGSAATSRWIAAALTSQDDAFKLEVHAKSRTASSRGNGSGLAGEIPSGAILALSVTGGGVIPANLRKQAATLSKGVGFDIGGLIGALDGPVIAYLRPGIPIPDVTLAAKPPQPQRAARAVGQLIRRFAKTAAPPVPTKLAGGTLEKVDLGSVALYYGVVAGKLVVTDSADALSELAGSAGRLTGDAVFKEAKDGAGLPDADQGFLYVDLKDAVPALTGFAQLANQKIPPSVEANLRPLRSLLVYATRDGDVQTFVAYLKTS